MRRVRNSAGYSATRLYLIVAIFGLVFLMILGAADRCSGWSIRLLA